MNKDNVGGFGTGLLVGLIMGAIAGFLFAPRSGRETREQVKDKAADLFGKAKEKASGVKESVGQRFSSSPE